MKKSFGLIALVLVMMLTLGTDCCLANGGRVIAGIDKLADEYKPQGVSVVLIENGKIAQIKNYGIANDKLPVNDQSVFAVASISKTVTAYAVMQLVDQDVLDLDAPVTTYLKRWQVPAGQFDESRLTLRTLMSHTAGLKEIAEPGTVTDTGQKFPAIEQVLKAGGCKLVREPGTAFRYSEFTNLGICQLIIEEVTGETFEEYMKVNVFRPLNMQSAGYDVTRQAPYVMAAPYAGLGHAVLQRPFVMKGAGGVTTTSTDLARFVIALMDYYHHGNKEMFTPQNNAGSAYSRYCLGISQDTTSKGQIIYQHNGTLVGWNAQYAFDPKTDNGIVVLTNSDRGFYFVYEALGVWSQGLGYGTVPMTAMVLKTKLVVTVIALLLLGVALLIFFNLILRVRNGKLVLAREARGRAIIISLLLTVLAVLWFIGWYTPLPCQWFFAIPNYYLFTFVTPNFHWISFAVLILLLLIGIRGFFKDGKRVQAK